MGRQYADGSSFLRLEFVGFDPGERLVFSIDVDEVEDYDPAETDPEVIYDGIDPITSGVEFQSSSLTAHFTAPNFEDAIAQSKFVNRYDPLLVDTGLDLPPDNEGGKRDRSAGAVAEQVQVVIPASLSGHVFHDANQNGHFDPDTESGLPGVVIQAIPLETLLEQDVLSATTDAQGRYQFAGLMPGRYRLIEVDQPDGYLDWLDSAGTVDGIASGTAVNPGDLIDDILLEGGSIGADYDFGEILPVSIGGSVHLATPDGDCFSDSIAHEPVAGARVQLLDAQGNVVRETQTNAQGRYRFDNLAPGTYSVREFTPDGLLDGGAQAGTIGGQTRGVVVGAGEVGQIQLFSGEEIADVEFCELQPVSIRGRVQLATPDGDCFSQTVQHDPVVGAVVKLANEQGQIIAETVTDSDGRYVFEELEPGTYSVFELTPDGLFDGGAQAGTVGGERRGSVTGPGEIARIILGSGEDLVDADFCELEPVAIRGRVQLATEDGDCFSEDERHSPLAGVEVRLLDANGNVVQQTVTNADGQYEFIDLAPGTYSVFEVTPAGVFEGGARAGWIDGQLDVSADVIDANLISEIVLGPGQVAEHYDFCELPPSRLSGFVFHDRDNDGVRDAGEAGISRVIVDLLDSTGELVDSTLTDDAGGYEFQNLRAGIYQVVELQPSGWLDGLDSAGTVAGQRRGQAQNPGDAIQQITIGWGQDGVDYNFGELLSTAILGDVHLSTVDGDCFSADRDHAPLAGVVVQLLDSQGQVLQETRTDAQGEYAFLDLAPGTYGVRELTPSDLIDGGAQLGRIAGVPVGVIVDPSTIVQIALESGEQILDVDFCEHAPSELSGHVFHDADNDGRRDAMESGIAQTVVILLDRDGREVARTRTDVAGQYRFTRLEAGEYRLLEIQPAGWLDGLDAPGTVDGAARGVALNPGDEIQAVRLGWGQLGIEYNFGELQPASLAGIVHTDLDDDCELDANEQRLAGVRIDLLNEQGRVVDTTFTNQAGQFEFVGLRPGVYAVREIQPAGYFQGGQRAGSGGGDASATDLIQDVVITSGMQLVDYRFCEAPPVEISGYVFQDGPPIVLGLGEALPEDLSQIRDGKLTPDDRRLPGVVLELRDGVTGRPISSEVALPGIYPAGPIATTTDANGYYHFDGLPEGNYAIFEIQPSGFIDGIDTGGSRPAIALNRHDYDQVDPQVVAALEYDPRFDAIVRIALYSGETSVENNFSEIVANPLQIPIFNPPTPPVRPLTPIVWESPAALIRPAVEWLNYQPTPYGRVRGARGSTWHLSVLDGGQLRGAGLAVPTQGPFWFDSEEEFHVAWQDPRAEQLHWVMLVDGQIVRERIFGISSGIPIAGDFNGDGLVELGVFHEGQWFIDINGNGRWDEDDLWAKLGHRGDQPVVGDWDGDGKDDIGVFGLAWPGDPRAVQREPGLPDRQNETEGPPKNRPPRVQEAAQVRRDVRLTARGETRSDVVDHVFHYGTTGDHAVAGDWNGDGIRNVGVFYKGLWHLDQNGDGRYTDEEDLEVEFGQDGDIPIVGDFNGDGVDEIGILSKGCLVLDMNRNYRVDEGDQIIRLNDPQGRPVVGDWNGDGVDDIALAYDQIRFVEVDARK